MADDDGLTRCVMTCYHGSLNLLLPPDKAVLEHLAKGNIGHIGFVPPERITGYTCNGCGKHYDSSPKVEVHISLDNRIMGRHGVNIACNGCGESVHTGYVSPEGIDPKFIVFDETGEYKTPTPEDIEKMLQEAMESAQEGKGSLDHGLWEKPLKVAETWAGKISYHIAPEIIDNIRETHEAAYLENFEEGLPGLVKEIFRHAHGFMPGDADGISHMEGTGLSEYFFPLLEALPHIKIDDPRLKRDICRILVTYMKMRKTEAEEVENEKKEIEKSLDKATAAVKDACDLLQDFTHSAQVPPDLVTNAIEHPLSTWPGDYDKDADSDRAPF